MGQTNSIASDILRQAKVFSDLASCSFDEFRENLKELNELSSHVTNYKGERLVFAVMKGSDDTILWRATVKVAVIQIDTVNNKSQKCRVLNLSQFIRVFTSIKDQMVSALHDTNSDDCDNDSVSSSSHEHKGNLTKRKELSCSMLLNNVDQVMSENLSECCICLDRKSEVMLTCGHAFCVTCIERWNSVSKNCPICREVSNTDDAWVLPDIPNTEDISQEIAAAILGLTSEPGSST